MKKALSLILALVLCLSLCICGCSADTLSTTSNTNNGINSEVDNNETTQTVHDYWYPFLEALYGDWEAKSVNETVGVPYTKLSVNKDGTCLVDGKECVWKIDYTVSSKKDLFIGFYSNTEYLCGVAVFVNDDGYYITALSSPMSPCFGTVWTKVS